MDSRDSKIALALATLGFFIVSCSQLSQDVSKDISSLNDDKTTGAFMIDCEDHIVVGMRLYKLLQAHGIRSLLQSDIVSSVAVHRAQMLKAIDIASQDKFLTSKCIRFVIEGDKWLPLRSR